MALEERSLAEEQYVDLTCGTENLSPYSSPAGYVDPPAYYPAEYDWPQHSQQAQLQTMQPHQQIMESDRQYYASYHSDGSDVSTHPYAGYGHQPMAATDFYSPAHGLWPAGSSSTSLVPTQLNPHHRFFSGIDLSQQGVVGQQPSTPTGSNGKPKRKRVQSYSQRKAANVRERRRMFHLNEAFDELRKRLPAFNYEKRLSRIETLRLAMTYISFMKEVSIGRDPKCVKLKPHGSDLSPLPRDGAGNVLMSHPSYSGSDNQDGGSNILDEDSDCSNDELSNHSGGN